VFTLIAAEVEGFFGLVGACAGADFPLTGAVASGIKEELALDVGGGLELGATEIVQRGSSGIDKIFELPKGGPEVVALAVVGEVA
jgi:hypothetical protein